MNDFDMVGLRVAKCALVAITSWKICTYRRENGLVHSAQQLMIVTACGASFNGAVALAAASYGVMNRFGRFK